MYFGQNYHTQGIDLLELTRSGCCTSSLLHKLRNQWINNGVSHMYIQVLQIADLSEPVSLIVMILRNIIFTNQRCKSRLILGNEKAVVIGASCTPVTVRRLAEQAKLPCNFHCWLVVDERFLPMTLVTAQNFCATLIQCRSKFLADGRERTTFILHDSYRIYFEGMRKLCR